MLLNSILTAIIGIAIIIGVIFLLYVGYNWGHDDGYIKGLHKSGDELRKEDEEARKDRCY